MANFSIPTDEQETIIHFMRNEDFATISTTDSTMITKMSKLCENHPDMYSLKCEDGSSKIYICKDKTLVSLRKKKREISEERKQAFGEMARQRFASKKA